jgi:hypothetical protein
VKRTILLNVLALALAGCGRVDPIDKVVAMENADPMWMNGMFPVIKLPTDSSEKEVIAKIFADTDFPGKGKNYEIAETKKVSIGGGAYAAAFIRSNNATAVFLMATAHNDKGEPYWWSRVVSVVPGGSVVIH